MSIFNEYQAPLRRPGTSSQPNQYTKEAEFLARLFHSRNVAHLVHLNTTSVAQHKTLNKYYDAILDLTDDLAETVFGDMGRLAITIPQATVEDINEHLTGLKIYINNTRDIFTCSAIQNIIDEIMGLIKRTMYLLTLN
jgi:hypothetical protein